MNQLHLKASIRKLEQTHRDLRTLLKNLENFQKSEAGEFMISIILRKLNYLGIEVKKNFGKNHFFSLKEFLKRCLVNILHHKHTNIKKKDLFRLIQNGCVFVKDIPINEPFKLIPPSMEIFVVIKN